MVGHLATVMSYLVAQSTRDIGVRIPLPGGAAGNDTRRDRDCGWIDWLSGANLPSTTSGFPILPNEDLAWDHFPGDVFLG